MFFFFSLFIISWLIWIVFFLVFHFGFYFLRQIVVNDSLVKFTFLSSQIYFHVICQITLKIFKNISYFCCFIFDISNFVCLYCLYIVSHCHIYFFAFALKLSLDEFNRLIQFCYYPFYYVLLLFFLLLLFF